jgi:transketolase
MRPADVKALSEFAHELRLIVLDQSKRAHVGHIGSELSIVDLIAVLYGHVLRIEAPTAPDRDRFILSKGHAALTLYGALALRGVIPTVALDTYCADDSLLGVHPEVALDGVDVSTGSLGQGLSIGTGSALAGRILGTSHRVFVLLSDAECNEGSVWEAAAFAAHNRLGNLTAVIDLNGQQALGYTDEVLSMSPMAPRWQSFGWDVHEVPGHDIAALVETFDALDHRSDTPHVIIAKTTFGHGVDFMENQIKWHYLPMSDDQYASAITQVRR